MKKKIKKQSTDVIGVKLVTGIDFIGIKKISNKSKNYYEKCTQIVLLTDEDGIEIRFMPLNAFDSDLNDIPYRDLNISKNFVLYEYVPDNKIISAYMDMLIVNEKNCIKSTKH